MKYSLECQRPHAYWYVHVPNILFAVHCSPLTAPLNGHLSSDATVSGTVVEVTCNDGYLLDGERELVCQSSGSWSTSMPACVQGLCCL